MDTEVNALTHLLMVYATQLTTVAMDVLASNARNPTSVRSRCFTTAGTTLNGISPVASVPVETNARVHSASVSASTIAKCAQTSTATRHSSGKCDWKRKKENVEEEEEDKKNERKEVKMIA